jgi:hypothetical protein
MNDPKRRSSRVWLGRILDWLLFIAGGATLNEISTTKLGWTKWVLWVATAVAVLGLMALVAKVFPKPRIDEGHPGAPPIP